MPLSLVALWLGACAARGPIRDDPVGDGLVAVVPPGAEVAADTRVALVAGARALRAERAPVVLALGRTPRRWGAPWRAWGGGLRWVVLSDPDGLGPRRAAAQRYWAPGAVHGVGEAPIAVVLPDPTPPAARVLLDDVLAAAPPGGVRLFLHEAAAPPTLPAGPWGALVLGLGRGWTIESVDGDVIVAPIGGGAGWILEAGGAWHPR